MLRLGTRLVGTVGVMAITSATALRAQSVSFRPRITASAGLAVYRQTGDTVQGGILLRLGISLESPHRPLSGQFEVAYHRIVGMTATCSGFLTGCSDWSPPAFDLWAVRGSGQWHLAGAARAFYVTAGVGGYFANARLGRSGGAGLGGDIGLGMRNEGRGFFGEVRCVRLKDGPQTAWLVPVTLGFLF